MNRYCGTVMSARASLATVGRELLMAREAMAMVASGASPRVILAGMRFGEQTLVSAPRLALKQGVRVNPAHFAEGRCSDLVVEPISE